jgi:hypothetical protein
MAMGESCRGSQRHEERGMVENVMRTNILCTALILHRARPITLDFSTFIAPPFLAWHRGMMLMPSLLLASRRNPTEGGGYWLVCAERKAALPEIAMKSLAQRYGREKSRMPKMGTVLYVASRSRVEAADESLNWR